LHIALAIEQYDPKHGGAELSSSQIVTALVERGHQVTVLAGRSPDGFSAPGLTLRRCPTGPARSGRTTRRFVEWVGAELSHGSFDVSLAVVTWLPCDVLEPRSGVIAEARERLVARRRFPLARAAKRVELLLSAKHRRMLALERRMLCGAPARRVVAISRYMREQLVRHYGLDADRIPLIHNGAEMPDPDPGWRHDVRRRYELADETPVFLFVANDPWRKGVRPLLAALKRLEGAVLLVAGHVRPAVEGLVRRLGLAGRVKMLGKVDNTAELYCAADVTVLPSYYDPASRVVIESLIMGTPAITTAYNGSRDLVDGGEHALRGRVIGDPDDIDALAGAMAELIDPDEHARCRVAAKGLKRELSMRRHAARLEVVLAEVA